MKKLILFTFFLIGSVLLFSCSKQDGKATDWEPTSYDKVNDLDGFTMMVKDDTISVTGVVVELKNDTEQQITYGDPFLLEKEIDGKWYQLPTIIEEYGFNDIGYEIEPSEVSEQTIWWEWLYGEIDSGKYRLIKTVLDVKEPGEYEEYVVAATFTIAE